MPGPGGPGSPQDLGNPTPVIDELDPLFKDLADLVGQLAGNEAAWGILYNQGMEVPVGDGWTYGYTSFTVPGPNGWTKENARYVIMSADNPDMPHSKVTNEDRERIVQQAVTDAWHEAHDSWTTGSVSSAYRSTSQNVWEPDPGAMAYPVNDLYDLTRWLNRQTQKDAGWVKAEDDGAPEWLTNLKACWPNTSLSSDTFYEFWDQVNLFCGMYLHAAARLASTSAMVAVTFSEFQKNLLDATKLACARAREALVQWQTWKNDDGYWPTGSMTDNSGDQTLLGGISLVTGFLGLIPGPQALPLGIVSVAAGSWGTVLGAQTLEMEALKAATADGISTGFINDLSTMDRELTKALDTIRTEPPNKHSDTPESTTGDQGFQSYAATVVDNRSDWTPPSVTL